MNWRLSTASVRDAAQVSRTPSVSCMSSDRSRIGCQSGRPTSSSVLTTVRSTTYGTPQASLRARRYCVALDGRLETSPLVDLCGKSWLQTIPARSAGSAPGLLDLKIFAAMATSVRVRSRQDACDGIGSENRSNRFLGAPSPKIFHGVLPRFSARTL